MRCRDNFLRLLCVSLLPLLCSSSNQSHPEHDGSKWICPFSKDLCSWEVLRTEALDPEAGLTDQGWTLSEKERGEGFPVPGGHARFLYLESSTELRSQVWSVPERLTSASEGVRVAFAFWSRGGDPREGVDAPLLSLLVVHNDTDYVMVWSSSSDGNASAQGWTRTTLCLPASTLVDDQQSGGTRLNFLGHIFRNSSLGISNVKVEKSEDCPSGLSSPGVGGRDEPSVGEGDTDDGPHKAWRLLIIVSLFLCFVALFLSTLFIVLGAKRKAVTIRQGMTSGAAVQNYRNPTFQFQYKRLDADAL